MIPPDTTWIPPSGIFILKDFKGQLFKKYVSFPLRAHLDHPLWTPPLLFNGQDRLFTGSSHVLADRTRHIHIFSKNSEGEITARVSGYIDPLFKDIKNLDGATGFLGHFDAMEDDIDAGSRVLQALDSWFLANNVNKIIGPFDANLACIRGVVIKGGDLPPSVDMPWTPPSYIEMFHQAGFQKECDFLVFERDFPTDWSGEGLAPAVQDLPDEYRCKNLNFLRAKGFQTFSDIMNQTFSKHFGFSPISSSGLKELMSASRFDIIPGTSLKIVQNKNPVAICYAMKNYHRIQQMIAGNFTLIKFLKIAFLTYTGKVLPEGGRLICAGCLSDHRGKKLVSTMVRHSIETFLKNGITHLEYSDVDENNAPSIAVARKFGFKETKAYRIYQKRLP